MLMPLTSRTATGGSDFRCLSRPNKFSAVTSVSGSRKRKLLLAPSNASYFASTVNYRLFVFIYFHLVLILMLSAIFVALRQCQFQFSSLTAFTAATLWLLCPYARFCVFCLQHVYLFYFCLKSHYELVSSLIWQLLRLLARYDY